MKLSRLLEPQTVSITVDEIDLQVKKLTWKEVKDFQSFASSQGDDEDSATLNLTKHILSNYITDEEGDMVINVDQVDELPVSFCVKLVAKFLDVINGDVDDTKKK